MKKISLIAVCAGIFGMLTSCSNLTSGTVDRISTATGIEYSNPTPTFDNSKIAPGLVFVEGGTFTMGLTADEYIGTFENPARKVTIPSFYIDRTEISNANYREYTDWLATAYSEYPAVRQAALPDSSVWIKPLAFNEPLAKMYFRHPAYNNYPVVGVSWIQASDYCVWRTNRVNEQLLLKAGQVTAEELKNNKGAKCFDTDAYNQGVSSYNSTIKPDAQPVVLFTSYRLPTEAEWEYAARPQELNKQTGLVESANIYPWEGATVRGANKRTKGHLMANFQKGRGDLKGPAGTRNTNAPTPLPVTSFYPNHAGLYNMAGNVNEWVLDVYRPLSFRDVEDSRPYRGNVNYRYKKNEQGNLMVDSLGRLVREMVADAAGSKSDYRSFRDGDNFSNQGMNAEMYGYGKDDTREGATSLISNSSRVYKGGSFIDRAYWINPATRRFLEENKAQVDLGFRCVMDYFGSN